ncbi:hypothetical protein FPRO04_12932 [Fusarium proliferatum]|nr:hypothetical protein FPRO03_10457 [Fusarium proliferatum]KAG4267437.1 hypothetical protein FPRO04_12932 [Fusarium proliferatum]
MASCCFPPLRPRGKATLQSWSRSYHSAVARFTTIDRRGMPISCDTGIMIGELDESFVYVEPEVGNAIRSAIIHQLGSGAFNHSETLPLQFNHDSKHFSYKSLPFPRIDIRQNLGQPESKISSATLWLSGNWHAITLDGTPEVLAPSYQSNCQGMINATSVAPEKASPASNIFEIAERKDLGDDVFTNVYEQWLPPAARGIHGGAQDETIFIITVSFTRETGDIPGAVEHTAAPFEVPAPPTERRRIDSIDAPSSINSSHNRRIFRQWFRFPGVIPKSGGPGAHLHALAFLTDGYFILAAARLHRIWRLPFALEDVPSFPPKLRSQVQRVNESEGLGSTIEEWAKRPRMAMAASLDHRIYFHKPLRTKADEWMVSEMESPWAARGRALVVQRMFAQDGTLLATCTQEV